MKYSITLLLFIALCNLCPAQTTLEDIEALKNLDATEAEILDEVIKQGGFIWEGSGKDLYHKLKAMGFSPGFIKKLAVLKQKKQSYAFPMLPRDLQQYKTPKAKSNIWALVIGINHYKNSTQLTPLSYAIKDAKDFTKHLLQIGVPINQIWLLLGKDVTKENINKALKLITQKPQRFYFFYAGHGLVVEDKGFFFTCQTTDVKQLETTAYAMSTLKNTLKNLTNESALLFIDACHSGVRDAEIGFEEEVTVSRIDNKAQEQLKNLEDNKNAIMLITSCSANQKAIEKDGNGLFTKCLLEGLRGKADENDDHKVMAQEILQYLNVHIAKLSEFQQRPDYGFSTGWSWTIDKGLIVPVKEKLKAFFKIETELVNKSKKKCSIFTQGEIIKIRIGWRVKNISSRERVSIKLTGKGIKKLKWKSSKYLKSGSSYVYLTIKIINNKLKIYNMDVIAKLGKLSQEQKLTSSIKPKEIKIPGFTYLRTKTYSCSGVTNTVREYQHNKTKMEFVLIPAGTFMMGSNLEIREQPIHKVRLSSFLISKTEVTQRVYQKIMGYNPSGFKKGDRYPVEMVSWHNANNFCVKVGLKLPTESQWEYACRAGTKSKFYWGNGNIFDYACHLSSSTYRVASKKTNAYGLYDMSGNVWEWCADSFYIGYLAGEKINPLVDNKNSHRVLRGGGWKYEAKNLRSANRGNNLPTVTGTNFGFRLCMDMEPRKVERFIKKQIPGFTYLRTKTYLCGGITNTVDEYQHNKTKMEFVLIPAMSFVMGSNTGEEDEKPTHIVTLKRFLISKTVVTQEVWTKIMGTTPWRGKNYVKEGKNYPATWISWNSSYQFCQKAGLDLPTEAQWEYACRARTTTKFYWGNSEKEAYQYAWYRNNAWDIGKLYPHQVKRKKPNAYGLYDMSGNVWEWCADEWSQNYIGAPLDGSLWGNLNSTNARRNRGGGFGVSVADIRSANRGWNWPGTTMSNLGFRVSKWISK